MADALDSKSSVGYPTWGFKSPLRHQIFRRMTYHSKHYSKKDGWLVGVVAVGFLLPHLLGIYLLPLVPSKLFINGQVAPNASKPVVLGSNATEVVAVL